MNTKTLITFFFTAALLSCVTPSKAKKETKASNATVGSLRVGTGKADVTPPANMFPFLCQHESYPHTGIHDSLYARALVMDNGHQRAVLAEVDEVAIPDAQNFLTLVAKAANVKTQDVILCVSHTHSTLHPNGEDERLQPVIDRIEAQTVKAVKAASASLQPAFVSFGRGKAYVNINNGESQESKGQYSTTGFSDKTLDIARFSRPDSSTIAVVVNYPTHAEVMFRSRSRDGGFEITGDLPGRVAQLMEQSSDHPLVLTTAGAEGDQQPIFTSRQHTTSMGYIDEGAGGWSIVDVLAHRLVDAAADVLAGMPLGENKVTLTTSSADAVVPGQHRHGLNDMKHLIDEPAADVHIPVGQIRLGDIAFDGIGADLASEIGVAVRNASPIKNTMLITATAGQVGYVLTDEAYRHYTHGVFGSKVRAGYAQDTLIKAVTGLK